MEGVERYKVRLLPYNTKWKNEYSDLKKHLHYSSPKTELLIPKARRILFKTFILS
jgi:hypothetical protein